MADSILALFDVRTLNNHLLEDIRKILKDKYLEYMHSQEHQAALQELGYLS